MEYLKKENNDTKFIPLGGLDGIGKNMYCIMHKDEIIVIDCGIMFPGNDLIGIDYVIPDFTFLKKNEEKIKAVIITHGHEDHVGGLPFLFGAVKIPIVYAPNQACGLIKRKLKRKSMRFDDLVAYTEETKIKTKYFDIEFFATTHSIPDSHGVILHTPNGIIVHTGDFKFDMTPIGPMSNIHKMADIGKNGIKLLLSESTNSLNEGFSISESRVDEALGEIFHKKTGRIIVATFASNIYRLKHIIETCRKNNRKVVLFGQSMQNNIDISIEGGYIKNDDNIIISWESANSLKPEEVCLLCTGSQGEPLAALSRIAKGTHRQIKLRPDDTVIFSSNPIPGNSSSVSKTINALYLQGVKVYTNTSLNEIHTSGHAQQEELKLMIRLFNPECFVPIHGDYRMLKKHINLAIDCGVKKQNAFLMENRDVLAINNKEAKIVGNIGGEDIYVDGKRVGEVGNIVIKDRKTLASEGILLAICNIDKNNRRLLGRVNITTRGFVLVNESEELLREIESIATVIVNKHLTNKAINYNEIKSQIINELLSFIHKKTGRRPLIVPVIMEVSK